jgi:hypothetical protein
MRSELTSTARVRIRAQLQRALSDVRAVLDDSPELDALSEDVAQLERAYG